MQSSLGILSGMILLKEWEQQHWAKGEAEWWAFPREGITESAALIAPHGCLEICQRVCTIIRYELSLDVSIDRKQFPGKAPLWEVSRQPPPALAPGSWSAWL